MGLLDALSRDPSPAERDEPGWRKAGRRESAGAALGVS
jgi:hypothetical protein